MKWYTEITLNIIKAHYPKISEEDKREIEDNCDRTKRKTQLNTVLTFLILLDRRLKLPTIQAADLNFIPRIPEIVLTCIILAHKYDDKREITNADFLPKGPIVSIESFLKQKETLRACEMNCLSALNYNGETTPEEARDVLVKYGALSQGRIIDNLAKLLGINPDDNPLDDSPPYFDIAILTEHLTLDAIQRLIELDHANCERLATYSLKGRFYILTDLNDYHQIPAVLRLLTTSLGQPIQLPQAIIEANGSLEDYTYFFDRLCQNCETNQEQDALKKLLFSETFCGLSIDHQSDFVYVSVSNKYGIKIMERLLQLPMQLIKDIKTSRLSHEESSLLLTHNNETIERLVKLGTSLLKALLQTKTVQEFLTLDKAAQENLLRFSPDNLRFILGYNKAQMEALIGLDDMVITSLRQLDMHKGVEKTPHAKVTPPIGARGQQAPRYGMFRSDQRIVPEHDADGDRMELIL